MAEGDTMLCLKALSPTRLVKNALYHQLIAAEYQGATGEELRQMLGRAASKRGIFEGDLEQGELEIGQIASAIKSIRPVATVMDELVNDFEQTRQALCNINF